MSDLPFWCVLSKSVEMMGMGPCLLESRALLAARCCKDDEPLIGQLQYSNAHEAGEGVGYD